MTYAFVSQGLGKRSSACDPISCLMTKLKIVYCRREKTQRVLMQVCEETCDKREVMLMWCFGQVISTGQVQPSLCKTVHDSVIQDITNLLNTALCFSVIFQKHSSCASGSVCRIHIFLHVDKWIVSVCVYAPCDGLAAQPGCLLSPFLG